MSCECSDKQRPQNGWRHFLLKSQSTHITHCNHLFILYEMWMATIKLKNCNTLWPLPLLLLLLLCYLGRWLWLGSIDSVNDNKSFRYRILVSVSNISETTKRLIFLCFWWIVICNTYANQFQAQAISHRNSSRNNENENKQNRTHAHICGAFITQNKIFRVFLVNEASGNFIVSFSVCFFLLLFVVSRSNFNHF